MLIQEMIITHPRKPTLGNMGISDIVSCATACFDCTDACTICADACLGEEKVQSLVRCIRVNQDCADICEVTGRLLTRQTETSAAIVRAQLESCMIACRACAEECDKHAQMHEHCLVCAEACRKCEEECLRMLEKIPATGIAAH